MHIKFCCSRRRPGEADYHITANLLVSCVIHVNKPTVPSCFLQVQVAARQPPGGGEHLHRDQPRQVQHFPCKTVEEDGNTNLSRRQII